MSFTRYQSGLPDMKRNGRLPLREQSMCWGFECQIRVLVVPHSMKSCSEAARYNRRFPSFFLFFSLCRAHDVLLTIHTVPYIYTFSELLYCNHNLSNLYLLTLQKNKLSPHYEFFNIPYSIASRTNVSHFEETWELYVVERIVWI